MVQSLEGASNPPGFQQYLRGASMPELGDDGIRLHARYGATLPASGSVVPLYPLNDAAVRFAQVDTVYHHRDASWSQVIARIDPVSANAGLVRDWVIGNEGGSTLTPAVQVT